MLGKVGSTRTRHAVQVLGGRPDGAIDRRHPDKAKITGTEGKQHQEFRAGHWPCSFFPKDEDLERHVESETRSGFSSWIACLSKTDAHADQVRGSFCPENL
jgi:hypothetical protein